MGNLFKATKKSSWPGFEEWEREKSETLVELSNSNELNK